MSPTTPQLTLPNLPLAPAPKPDSKEKRDWLLRLDGWIKWQTGEEGRQHFTTLLKIGRRDFRAGHDHLYVWQTLKEAERLSGVSVSHNYESFISRLFNAYFLRTYGVELFTTHKLKWLDGGEVEQACISLVPIVEAWERQEAVA